MTQCHSKFIYHVSFTSSNLLVWRTRQEQVRYRHLTVYSGTEYRSTLLRTCSTPNTSRQNSYSDPLHPHPNETSATATCRLEPMADAIRNGPTILVPAYFGDKTVEEPCQTVPTSLNKNFVYSLTVTVEVVLGDPDLRSSQYSRRFRLVWSRKCFNEIIHQIAMNFFQFVDFVFDVERSHLLWWDLQCRFVFSISSIRNTKEETQTVRSHEIFHLQWCSVGRTKWTLKFRKKISDF